MNTCKKSILVFAVSGKKDGLCVAGRAWNGESRKLSEWIRPVTPSKSEAIPTGLITFKLARQLRPFDGVTIEFVDAQPSSPPQVENQQIHSSRWVISKTNLLDQVKPDKRLVFLRGLVCDLSNLWSDFDDDANRRGRDRIAVESAHRMKSSLAFIEVSSAAVYSRSRPEKFDQLRVNFEYNHRHYDFSLTDVAARKKYGGMAANRPIKLKGPQFICVSLGVEFHGFHYKLAASLISGLA